MKTWLMDVEFIIQLFLKPCYIYIYHHSLLISILNILRYAYEVMLIYHNFLLIIHILNRKNIKIKDILLMPIINLLVYDIIL
jgi:hypothetical protein